MKQQLTLWLKRQMTKLNLPLSTEYTDPNELIVPEPSSLYEQYFIDFIGIEGRDGGNSEAYTDSYVRSTPLLRPLLCKHFGTDAPSEIRFELCYSEAQGYQLFVRHDLQRYLLVNFSEASVPKWFAYYDELYDFHTERWQGYWLDQAERFPDQVEVYNKRHDPKGARPWDDHGTLLDGTDIATLGSQTYIIDVETDEALSKGFQRLVMVKPGELYYGKNGTEETLFKIAS